MPELTPEELRDIESLCGTYNQSWQIPRLCAALREAWTRIGDLEAGDEALRLTVVALRQAHAKLAAIRERAKLVRELMPWNVLGCQNELNALLREIQETP